MDHAWLIVYLRNVKGFKWNHKRVHMIYRELELNLRIKPRPRLVREKPLPLAVPTLNAERWRAGRWRITMLPSVGVPGVWHQPDVLPLSGQTERRERSDRRLAGAIDEQPAQLGLRPLLPGTPLVEGRGTHAMFTAQFGDGRAGFTQAFDFGAAIGGLFHLMPGEVPAIPIRKVGVSSPGVSTRTNLQVFCWLFRNRLATHAKQAVTYYLPATFNRPFMPASK
jgi:hypothetical protein